jgi:serine/threonine protein kinase
MELTVQNVYGLLLRSKLLPIDDARALFERWQKEAGPRSTDLTLFNKWLVTNQYLTEYQVTLLGRGHADGFFLNQYKILDRLGKGRMAGVYKAEHELGQIVAIKVLPPSKSRDAGLLARFQREARLAIRLKHPNIVRAFQVSDANGVHYFVMEHLEGETLDETLQRRGKLPTTEAVRLVYFALLGLQHIHEQGLVHRDLKPANLMLVPAPTPGPNESTLRSAIKILDIGLGRELFDESTLPRQHDGGLTIEGVILGTPDYMSPEQARDARTTDIRADIYSLGCVLYHCLAGRPPFPDTNLVSQMIRHATETPRPLKEFNPTVPDGLQQIVNWMLAKDPAQRYPTPERAAQALQVFLAAGTDPKPAAPAPDAKMSSYLLWLEGEDRQPGSAAKPPSGAAAAAPAKPPSGAVPTSVQKKANPQAKTGGEGTDRTGKRRHPKKHKRHAPGKTPKAGGAATASPEAIKAAKAARAARLAKQFDVELVPMPGATPGAPAESAKLSPGTGKGVAPGGFHLQVRDLILLGIGGGSFLLAIVLGWLLANWSGLLLTGQDFIMFSLGVASVLLLAPLVYLGYRVVSGVMAKRRAEGSSKKAEPPPATPAAPATPAVPAAIPVAQAGTAPAPPAAPGAKK